VPANPSGSDVEACVDAAHPSGTAATTSPSGTVTINPLPSSPSGAAATSSTGTMPAGSTPTDPCDRIRFKRSFVHEEFHRRHDNALARAQGSAFFRRWTELAGNPARIATLETEFPTESAAFRAQRNDGHDWAQDEINSYRWARRFLDDTLAALNRICP
jgi:hypothetical protein